VDYEGTRDLILEAKAANVPLFALVTSVGVERPWYISTLFLNIFATGFISSKKKAEVALQEIYGATTSGTSNSKPPVTIEQQQQQKQDIKVDSDSVQLDSSSSSNKVEEFNYLVVRPCWLTDDEFNDSKQACEFGQGDQFSVLKASPRSLIAQTIVQWTLTHHKICKCAKIDVVTKSSKNEITNWQELFSKVKHNQ